MNAEAREVLLSHLVVDEGVKLHAYQDHLGLSPRSPQWCGCRPLVSPTVVETSPVGTGGDAVSLGDVPPRSSVWGLGDECSIHALCLLARPSAVAREVSEGVIASLNTQMLFITRGVGPVSERFVLMPRRAHADATAAVDGVRGVTAPGHHPFPYAVQSRPGFAVSCEQGATPSRLVVPARRALTRSQIGPCGPSMIPAVASTEPNSGAPLGVAVLSKDDERAESGSRNVNQAWIGRHYSLYRDHLGLCVRSGRHEH